MLREHEPHVPSVEVSNDTSDSDSWTEFLDRVDSHDRSLFTEGISLQTTQLPDKKPDGSASILYAARRNATPLAPILDSLWHHGGVAPMPVIANETGLLPQQVSAIIGKRLKGMLEIQPAEKIHKHTAEDANPNIRAISEAVKKGGLERRQSVVISRPICKLYEKKQPQEEQFAAD